MRIAGKLKLHVVDAHGSGIDEAAGISPRSGSARTPSTPAERNGGEATTGYSQS